MKKRWKPDKGNRELAAVDEMYDQLVFRDRDVSGLPTPQAESLDETLALNVNVGRLIAIIHGEEEAVGTDVPEIHTRILSSARRRRRRSERWMGLGAPDYLVTSWPSCSSTARESSTERNHDFG